MARKTVKVKVPINSPDKFITLMESILKHHTKLGKESPLNNHPRVDFRRLGTNVKQASELRDQAAALYAKAEELMMQARKLMGLEAGQNIHTPGTAYNASGEIKKHLLNHHSGEEEALSNYGFEVVVGSARTGVKRKKKDVKEQ